MVYFTSKNLKGLLKKDLKVRCPASQSFNITSNQAMGCENL
jgi:hypothetical protein